jgi:hypothetical protein
VPITLKSRVAVGIHLGDEAMGIWIAPCQHNAAQELGVSCARRSLSWTLVESSMVFPQAPTPCYSTEGKQI